MSLKTYLLGSAAVASTLLGVAPAYAQSSAALNSQIRSLQEQVRTLNQQMQNLQTQVVQTQRNQAVTNETVTQIRARPAPASAAGAGVLKVLNGEPVFESADGENTLALTGRLHLDVGAYSWRPASSATSPQNLNDGINARRARLGVQGKFLGDWGYALIFDMGGSNDTGAGGTHGGGIENAFFTYNGVPGFHFTLGYIDVPYTLDESTSSNNIMFMEKSIAGDIATGIAGNDNRSAAGVSWNNDRAWVGIFGTGPTTGTIHNFATANAVQFGATGRATYELLQTPEYSFHVGVDAEGLVKPAKTATAGVQSISLSNTPELRVDPTALIGTGSLGTAANPVTGASVYGFETAGGFGPFYAQGEYFHYNVARSGLSDLAFNGGYVEASYTLTGEMRKYAPGCGCYGGIAPARPFSLKAGTWGAWELAARYSVVDLNDQAVLGGNETNYTVGLNWYPNNNMRFMLNYIHADVDKTRTAPAPTNIGGTMDAIALRSQFAF